MLNLCPGDTFIDGTLGMGGHSARLFATAGSVKGIGFDRDAEALELAQKRLAQNDFTGIHSAFSAMPNSLRAIGVEAVNGIVLDLGVSSLQLDQAERGFSFRNPGPIDMRMDPSRGRSAFEFIRETQVEKLANTLWEFGEERFSKRIAPAIKEAVKNGEANTTAELAEVISNCIPGKEKRKRKTHPATKSFQAIRIAVNDELGELQAFLSFFPSILAPGGRCAIISFHSLEDRLVKNCFRDLEATSSLPPEYAKQAGERIEPICVRVTKKPVVPSDKEITGNARARSAKLRVCERSTGEIE